MANPRLEAALEYADRGWPVMPAAGADGKKPLVTHGVLDASADPIVIYAWWSKWPDANVAIATGWPGPNVLDVDDPEAGRTTLIRLAAEGLDRTSVNTLRGAHLYFEGSAERTLKLPYGELRRQGSYVMAPPSTRPDRGGMQGWIWAQRGAKLGIVPEWLTEGRQTAGAGEAPVVDKVPPGAMYDHLLDLSVRLARAGMLDLAARERALQAEFEARRVPGATYNGTPEDTRRLATAPSDILAREAEKAAPLSPPKGGQRRKLIFRTPAELRAETPAIPSWLWHGCLAAGLITVVGGRPKVGKSTLIYEAIDRLVAGEGTFLGAELTPTDVVILSEEHAVTALNKLHDSDRLHLLTRDHAWPLPDWGDAVGDAVEAAEATEAKLLVVDSFTFWASLEAEAANHAGAIQERLMPLVEASHKGIGTLLIHHQRKAGGEYGEALLGATAFAANADIILEVERMGEGSAANLRRINRLSRWPVAPVLLTRFDADQGYSLVAEAESTHEAEDLAWAERIRELLQPDKAMRQTELDALLGVDGRTWSRAMHMLTDNGEVLRTGAGGVKDPIVYNYVPANRRSTPPEI